MGQHNSFGSVINRFTWDVAAMVEGQVDAKIAFPLLVNVFTL